MKMVRITTITNEILSNIGSIQLFIQLLDFSICLGYKIIKKKSNLHNAG